MHIPGYRYAIVGAQPYQVFQQAIARLMAEAGDDVRQGPGGGQARNGGDKRV